MNPNILAKSAHVSMEIGSVRPTTTSGFVMSEPSSQRLHPIEVIAECNRSTSKTIRTDKGRMLPMRYVLFAVVYITGIMLQTPFA